MLVKLVRLGSMMFGTDVCGVGGRAPVAAKLFGIAVSEARLFVAAGFPACGTVYKYGYMRDAVAGGDIILKSRKNKLTKEKIKKIKKV